MNIESTKLQNSTETAIGYIPCYAQVFSRLFLGDCLELYKNIEPKSIDLILTDLPYGTTACKWDTIIPFDKLWEMVNYLLKPNGVFITTASQPFTSALVMSNPKMFKHNWVWDKISITNPFQVAYAPLKCHEDILVFYNNKPTYNAQKTEKPKNEQRPIKFTKNYSGDREYKEGVYGSSKKGLGINHDETKTNPKSIIQIPSVYKKNTIHPTQKPIALMQYLLKTYSNENMIIFDPCMGSGTTGIACKNLNRNFIGIEKDEAYFKIAEQRINARTLFS